MNNTRNTTARRKFITLGCYEDGRPLRFCRETAELSRGARATKKNTVVVTTNSDIAAIEDAYSRGNFSEPSWIFKCRDIERNMD